MKKMMLILLTLGLIGSPSVHAAGTPSRPEAAALCAFLDAHLPSLVSTLCPQDGTLPPYPEPGLGTAGDDRKTRVVSRDGGPVSPPTIGSEASLGTVPRWTSPPEGDVD